MMRGPAPRRLPERAHERDRVGGAHQRLADERRAGATSRVTTVAIDGFSFQERISLCSAIWIW
jgi:hypothetical protein